MDKLAYVAKALGFQYRDVPNSFMESLKCNIFSFNHGLLESFGRIMEQGSEELIDYEFESEELGGIIVFSTTVNATVGDDAKKTLKQRLKGAWETLKNKVKLNKTLDQILFVNNKVAGASIGNFFKGRYTAKDGSLYSEKSLAVEVIGITFELLVSIASEMAKAFQQETVLVKSNGSKRIVLVKAAS
jgi:hypothetical protein